MSKQIRPTISLGSIAALSAMEPPAQARVLTPIQEAELAEIVGWLRKLTESSFRGSVTLHFNGAGAIDRNIELKAKILLDRGNGKR